jgi:hypothetical protein
MTLHGHDPRESMDRLQVVLMLLLFLVVGAILGAVVLFLTDIFLGRLEDGVRLVETHLPRAPAAQGLTIYGPTFPRPSGGSHVPRSSAVRERDDGRHAAALPSSKSITAAGTWMPVSSPPSRG